MILFPAHVNWLLAMQGTDMPQVVANSEFRATSISETFPPESSVIHSKHGKASSMESSKLNLDDWNRSIT
jgi:hypothetical protein